MIKLFEDNVEAPPIQYPKDEVEKLICLYQPIRRPVRYRKRRKKPILGSWFWTITGTVLGGITGIALGWYVVQLLGIK